MGKHASMALINTKSRSETNTDGNDVPLSIIHDTLTKWYLTPKYKRIEVIIKPDKSGVDPQGIDLINKIRVE